MPWSPTRACLRASLTPEHERLFFASGASLVTWMLGVIDAALVPQFAPMSTLEYGCGIGRLALPLAQRPGTVVAVDRSAAMLDRARAEAARRGLDHIVFARPGNCSPRRVRSTWSSATTCCSACAGTTRWNCCGGSCRSSAPTASACSSVAAARASPRSCARRGDSATGFRRPTPRRTGCAARPPTSRSSRRMSTRSTNRSRSLPPPVSIRCTSPSSGTRASTTIAFAQRRVSAAPRPAPPRETSSEAAAAEQVSDAELETWNRAAETYFASLTAWDHHLAKPFSQMDETPAILGSVAVLLQSLAPARGMTVLEFGAGTGWLSRFLTQMGCRAILLDVSPTALDIAREHFVRQPVLGEHAAPVFLHFDGRRLGLPDASVDRIVCFDAFHHAPNPHEALGELARVRRPGGIAGFVEPGPRHAEAPRSRFESGTYGVVERDVDVHDIWRAARRLGFADLRMCVFHLPPYHVSIDEYEDLLAGGAAGAGWLTSTRTFLRNVRSFYLVKEGESRPDSRGAAGLACEIHASFGEPPRADHPIVVDVVVSNTGTALWAAVGIAVRRRRHRRAPV